MRAKTLLRKLIQFPRTVIESVRILDDGNLEVDVRPRKAKLRCSICSKPGFWVRQKTAPTMAPPVDWKGCRLPRLRALARTVSSLQSCRSRGVALGCPREPVYQIL